MATKSMILGAVAVVGVGALLFWAFRADPVPVDLAPVERGELMQTINADGKTRIRDVFEISAPITGRTLRSPVEIGDEVKAGHTVVAVVQPVAPTLLDDRSRRQAEAAVAEAEAALQVAISRVRQAEEDLSYAQSQYARAAELVDRGVATLTRLEDATQIRAIKDAALEAAYSSRAMAEGALARARAALIAPNPEEANIGPCCIELHAPADGVVLSIASISERPVTMGAPLLSIGRPDDLEIVADFLSSDAVRVAPGARAFIERWGGDQPLEAVLRKIEPSARTKVSALGIEEQRVDLIFDLVSDPATRPGLGDGFAVFVRVVAWRNADTLHVPISALFRNGADWYVFREVDGRAARTAVTLGHRNRVAAEILNGLEEADVVVTHPSDKVVDGVSIVDRAALE